MINDTHFVRNDPLKLNNPINTCLTNLEIILCNIFLIEVFLNVYNIADISMVLFQNIIR